MIAKTTRSLITLADGTLTPLSTLSFFNSQFNSAATLRHHHHHHHHFPHTAGTLR